MKTIQEIKDEVLRANIFDRKPINCRLTHEFTQHYIDMVAKTYAKQFIEEAADRAKCGNIYEKTGHSGIWLEADVDKDSILSLLNDLK